MSANVIYLAPILQDQQATAVAGREIIKPRELIANSRSSGFGVSFHKNFHRCPMYAYLSGKAPETLEKGETEPNLDETQPDEDSGYFAHVGVLFHKLCELYYQDRLKDVIFEFAGDSEPVAWTEAIRLFNYYRTQFKNTEFKVIGTEMPFRFESNPTFGVPLFTGRFDLMAEITAEHLQSLRERRAIPLLYPGAYVLDHKVKWRRNSKAAEEWDYLIQLWLYMMAWDLLHPENPCRGAIVNVVYAYKQHKHEPGKGTARCSAGKICDGGGAKAETFFVRPPGPQRREIARNFLKTANKLQTMLGYRANTEECFRFTGRVCQFHPSVGGPCDLIGEVKE